jgi:hypothetical protein
MKLRLMAAGAITLIAVGVATAPAQAKPGSSSPHGGSGSPMHTFSGMVHSFTGAFTHGGTSSHGGAFSHGGTFSHKGEASNETGGVSKHHGDRAGSYAYGTYWSEPAGSGRLN